VGASGITLADSAEAGTRTRSRRPHARARPFRRRARAAMTRGGVARAADAIIAASRLTSPERRIVWRKNCPRSIRSSAGRRRPDCTVLHPRLASPAEKYLPGLREIKRHRADEERILAHADRNTEHFPRVTESSHVRYVRGTRRGPTPLRSPHRPSPASILEKTRPRARRSHVAKSAITRRHSTTRPSLRRLPPFFS